MDDRPHIGKSGDGKGSGKFSRDDGDGKDSGKFSRDGGMGGGEFSSDGDMGGGDSDGGRGEHISPAKHHNPTHFEPSSLKLYRII